MQAFTAAHKEMEVYDSQKEFLELFQDLLVEVVQEAKKVVSAKNQMIQAAIEGMTDELKSYEDKVVGLQDWLRT